MRTLREITFASAEEADAKRENANVDGNSAMGSMLRYGTESAKQFNLLEVLDPTHAAAHRDGDIHIHDLDFLTLTTTCCRARLLHRPRRAASPAIDRVVCGPGLHCDPVQPE